VVKSRRWCGKMNEEEIADVRAIALKVLADNFYWKLREWKTVQADKLALQKLCEIYEFLRSSKIL